MPKAPPPPPPPSRSTETAIIVNNRPALLVAPAIHRKNRDGLEEIYPRKSLVPGANTVPAGYVEELEDMDERGPGAVWAMWRRLGYVKLPRPEEMGELARVGEGLPPPASIADRNPMAVEAMVATEDNPEVLRAWYASDRRKESREAITARLKALTEPEAPPAPPAPAK